MSSPMAIRNLNNVALKPEKFCTVESNTSTQVGSGSRASSPELSPRLLSALPPLQASGASCAFSLGELSASFTGWEGRDEASPFASTPASSPSLTMTVKHSFLHFIDAQELETAAACLRRSSSAPALMTSLAQEAADVAEKESSAEEEMTLEDIVAEQAAQSEAHDKGECKPCLYFAFKADSCRKGDMCTFCHRCERKDILAKRKEAKHARKQAVVPPSMSRLHARHRRTKAQQKKADPLFAGSAASPAGAAPAKRGNPAMRLSIANAVSPPSTTRFSNKQMTTPTGAMLHGMSSH